MSIIYDQSRRRVGQVKRHPAIDAGGSSRATALAVKGLARERIHPKASCVDDPVEARAIWYVAPRSGAVMCPAYVARPLGPLALMQSAAWLPNRFTRWTGA